MAALSSEKKVYPSADRNKGPIWETLKDELPQDGLVVTVAEGSGQHVSHFASQAPAALQWQPTELDVSCHASIKAWSEGIASVKAPMALDVRSRPWPFDDGALSAIININMIHISPWECTEAMLAEAGRTLRPGGLLFMYGPYRVNGDFTSPSNADFDVSLRGRDPSWGLRNLEEVVALAASHGLRHDKTVDMPANNFSVLYRKQ